MPHGVKTITRPRYTINYTKPSTSINQMLLQQTHIDNAKREALQILEVENKTIYTLHQDMTKLIQTGKIEFEQIDTLLQRNTLSDQEKSKLLNIVDKKLTNPKKYGQD